MATLEAEGAEERRQAEATRAALTARAVAAEEEGRQLRAELAAEREGRAADRRAARRRMIACCVREAAEHMSTEGTLTARLEANGVTMNKMFSRNAKLQALEEGLQGQLKQASCDGDEDALRPAPSPAPGSHQALTAAVHLTPHTRHHSVHGCPLTDPSPRPSQAKREFSAERRALKSRITKLERTVQALRSSTSARRSMLYWTGMQTHAPSRTHEQVHALGLADPHSWNGWCGQPADALL